MDVKHHVYLLTYFFRVRVQELCVKVEVAVLGLIVLNMVSVDVKQH